MAYRTAAFLFCFLPLLIFFLFLLSSSILSHKVTCTHTHIHIYWVILNILLVSLWVLLFATPVDCSTPGFPVIHYLPQFAQTHVHLVGDAIQPFHPLSSWPQSFPASRSFPMSWLFTSVAQSTGASASLLPMNSELLSFRINWFDFLAVQETLKSLLQHHNLKASVLWCSAFFMVQLSHPYMTAGKTIALTIQTCLCFLIYCLCLS